MSLLLDIIVTYLKGWLSPPGLAQSPSLLDIFTEEATHRGAGLCNHSEF